MPAPRTKDPQFNPMGRYLMNVQERKIAGPTYFHDDDNLSEDCGVASMPPASITRFNNPVWAVGRGYTPCPLCVNHG